MLAPSPQTRVGGSDREARQLVVQQCVDEAANRAAKRIPHLDFDCLRAILSAHVEVTIESFRGEAPLENWLKRVLRNKVVDLIKFESAAPKGHAPAALDPTELDLADPREGPLQEVSLRELRDLVETEHGETREGRILLLLLSGEATTVTQAARALGWNHPTALSRLRRHPVVLELLREAL